MSVADLEKQGSDKWMLLNPLTEVDEKAPVAPALVLWKNHDARHIVLLLTVFLLEKREDDRIIRRGGGREKPQNEIPNGGVMTAAGPTLEK